MYDLDVVEGSLQLIPVDEMVEGDLGKIIESPIPAYLGTILLRTYSQYVSLREPVKTWHLTGGGPRFKVRLLPPGTVLTLTIK